MVISKQCEKCKKKKKKKAMLEPVFIRLFSHALWRPSVYSQNFRPKQEVSKSYLILITFINIPFALSFLQTFKTPEAIVLGLFWVVFQVLLPQMSSNLYRILPYIIMVSLISIAFVVDNLYIFKIFRISSASIKWPFLGGFLGLNSPKYGSILLQFSHQVVIKERKTLFEESLKN